MANDNLRELSLESVEVAPVTGAANYYAGIIREKSIMRQAIAVGSAIAQLGYEVHGSAAEFLAQVEERWSAIREAAADTDESSAFVLFLPVADFFAKCGERVEYILEPYLPKASFVIVGGAPKSGKTFFVGWLACEIAKAGKTVMFVEEEGSKETLRERLQPFLTKGAALHVAHRKGFRLDDERSVNRLIEEVKVAGAQVLILDPLVQLHGHVRQMGDVPAEVIQAIQRIIRETGCAVVLIHHTRKGKSWEKGNVDEAESAELAGSYAWAGSADNIIQIKAVPNTERRLGEVRFYVENSDTRNGEPFPRRLAVVKVNARGDADAMTFVEPESQNKAEIRRLLPYIPFEPEVITVDDLRDEAGGNAERVRSAIRFAVGDRIIGRRKGKNGGVYRVKNDRLVGDGPRWSPPSTDHRLDSIEESAEGSAVD